MIAEAWGTRELLKDKKYSDAVRAVIEEVDKGRLRTAAPTESGAFTCGFRACQFATASAGLGQLLFRRRG